MTTITGGCLCGDVRYAYEGEVGPAGYCHCSDCRHVSGSAFGISVRVAASDFRIVAGAPSRFTKRGDSGREVSRFFCGACGSPLYTLPPRHPEVVFIKAGSLDDPSVVKPDREAWTRSRVDWAEIDPAVAATETGRG
ncbi:GFA family protein [Devosia sp.]|uniref:GFA family protein n=1 Tax=Devosia sp. TaxID=1871048 RepID=UPI003A8E0E8B